MKNLSLICSSVFILMTSLPPTQSYAAPDILTADRELSAPIVEFTPSPTNNVQINYDEWDRLLGEMILFMGPSARQKFRAPIRETGSRISRTHNSPYRLEGNKVLYPFMGENIVTAIADYVAELEQVGTNQNISTLSRNEQLAFWINLHNSALLLQVATHYPGPNRKPRLIKPIKGQEALLNDAKILEVNGIRLSLKDIRERIVFPNWQNPDVAFAFHLGDASSPSFANIAYDPNKLSSQLRSNADEYVNSLRGIDDGKVSRYIHDIAPWYFPDFERDLESYFKSRMRPDVYKDYLETGYQGVNRYDDVVSDITAGYGKRGRQRLALSTDLTSFALGRDVQQFLARRAEKIEQLRKQDWFKRGTVIIEDIETDDGEPVEIK